ncbi:MAG: restriction endonuclease subunit S [Paludibacter sp.]|nr:restriction endonuclease subunit S [Paludibacter sp.]
MMLSEIIEFNPTRSIKKGTNAPFIEMAALNQDSRDISYVFQKEFNGSGTKFKNGDTLLARITPCLENGKTAKVNCLKEGEHAHGSTEFIVLKAKEPEYDEDFIYYLCRWTKFRDYAIGRMEGSSGRQRVDWKAIAEFECDLPAKEERKKIGFFLKLIDDKIANNNRINQTVESIAQTLFKSWFIDFDPVKARVEDKKDKKDTLLAALEMISGKRHEEMQNFPSSKYNELRTIADLFPEEFEDSELGWIPKGWSLTSLYETAEYVNGGAFRNGDFSPDKEGLPIIKIAELKSGISPQTQYTTNEVLEKYHINNGDMLYSWSGSPETSLDVFKWFGGEGWLNQHIFKINTKTKEQKVFVYFLLQHLKPQLIEIAKNKQTTGLGHVTIADMKRINIVMPSEKDINLLMGILIPLFDKSSNCMQQNMVLGEQRDTLLPQLLSGKINFKM